MPSWPTRSPSSGGWLAIHGSPRRQRTSCKLPTNGDGIHLSAITLVDIWYATHKRTDPIATDQLAALDAVLDDPEINIHVLPVTNAVAHLAREPSRDELPDPFDRLILATARAYGMPLVSPDRALRHLALHPAAW
ncbi:MAG: type II toxin-antitoxin system VapC family toxin [Nitriliruptorales bacterium]